MRKNKSRLLAVAALLVMAMLTVMPFAVMAEPDETAAVQEQVETVATDETVEQDLEVAEESAVAEEESEEEEPASKLYGTIWALLPPIIAIGLALITKEVYSSLFIGIVAGGLLYSGFNFEGTIVHVLSDGFIASLAD